MPAAPATRIALLCATRRGQRCLERIADLLPAGKRQVTVVSFREEPWEPPFLDNIRAAATSRGFEFHEAKSLDGALGADYWKSSAIDLMLAINWRYRVSPAVAATPRRGAFVFHDSLLPAYRGFSPTVWAMINGERQTGVTLLEMADEIDTGDIVAQEPVPIGADDTIETVTERVTEMYLRLFEIHLPSLLNGTAARTRQDTARATYCCKRLPADNRIDWTASAARVYNLIRAVTRPYPGAFTTLDSQRLTIFSAALPHDRPRYVGVVPGRVVEIRPGDGVLVLAGDGPLLIRDVRLGDRGPVRRADLVIQSIAQTLGGNETSA